MTSGRRLYVALHHWRTASQRGKAVHMTAGRGIRRWRRRTLKRGFHAWRTASSALSLTSKQLRVLQDFTAMFAEEINASQRLVHRWETETSSSLAPRVVSPSRSHSSHGCSPQSPGPHSRGPQSPGAQSPGAQSPGAHRPGPRARSPRSRSPRSCRPEASDQGSWWVDDAMQALNVRESQPIPHTVPTVPRSWPRDPHPPPPTTALAFGSALDTAPTSLGPPTKSVEWWETEPRSNDVDLGGLRFL